LAKLRHVCRQAGEELARLKAGAEVSAAQLDLKKDGQWLAKTSPS